MKTKEEIVANWLPRYTKRKYGAEHIARHSLYPEFLRIDAEVAGEVQ